MTTMRALTIWQPWASLIAEGVKTSETRSWAAPRGLWGTTIGIHAAKRPARLDECEGPVHSALIQVGIFGERHGPGLSDTIDSAWALDALPYGAVVATARLVECVQVWAISSYGTPLVRTPDGERKGGINAYGLGDYSVGRWVWRLENIVKLSEPIPARGQQGLWTWQRP